MSKMDWNHLRAFHATAAAGSLSAAARQLDLTQPTLSRQVLALEKNLGVALFERVGRKLVLTQTGLDLLSYIETMGNAADAFALAANGRVKEVSGRVCISATDNISTYILPAIIERIRVEAPQITVVMVAANELSNLHQMEADIAIRHVAPDKPSLVGTHIRDAQAYFYASKEWVARKGVPQKFSDLNTVDIIGFDDTIRLSTYLRGLGFLVESDDFRLVSNSSVVIWEMVKRGIGIAAMLREVAEQTPEVMKIFPDMEPIPVPIWLVTHKELQFSPRIHFVQNILAEMLA